MPGAWQLFLAEARPFRETSYWEAVARTVADYSGEHPAASPEDVLTDCLIAIQCPPLSDDRMALTELHTMWQEGAGGYCGVIHHDTLVAPDTDHNFLTSG